jgi:hypothetical protein
MRSGSTVSCSEQMAKHVLSLGLRNNHTAHTTKNTSQKLWHIAVSGTASMVKLRRVENVSSYHVIDAQVIKYPFGTATIRVGTRQQTTGKLKFKGNELKHAAGVPFLVDCNVTGSDVGTATKPCFPLRRLWEFTLISAIAQLVDVGGACEGAQVVLQQDNAGPHIEVEYRGWMQHIFDELGWMYEPQAPQGMRNTLPVHAIF